MTEFRVGQGLDVHAFEAGRPLFLGGVEIPHTHGLKGHSDADALVHALVDAILGALAMGDIGKFFPDTDPQYKGKSSVFFLEKVRETLKREGWNIANLDSTVFTEAPILRPYIESMRAKISETLEIKIDQVSVKATRPEKMGAYGREEGLMAQAIVLLTRG